MHRNGQNFVGIMLSAVVLSVFAFLGATAQTRVAALKAQGTDRKIAEALEALRADDLTRAEKLIVETLAAAPRNVDALTLAGVIRDRQNDLVKAEKHFAAAARFAPQSAETRNNYGAILLRLGRKAEAAREFAASLRINPRQPSALVNLGQIRAAENNLAAARELLTKAKAIAPDPEILRALVLISLRLGEKETAAREYAEFASARNNSETPPSAAKTDLAEGLLKAGLLREARGELEFLLGRAAEKTDLLILLARVHLEQNDIKAAGRLLETAVAGGNTEAKMYAALADVYARGGYFENAIPAMRLAIDKDPKNELYRVRYGILLIDSKAPAAAVIRLQEALGDFPDSPKILLALGIAQQIDGKSGEAQASFERGLKLAPDSVPLLAYLALVLDEKGDYAETVLVLERALRAEETNAVLHYLLADTIMKMPAGELARVEKHLSRAIALDPQMPQAHLALGRLFARQNRWTEAAASFEKAVALAGELPDAHYQLGRALARLKKTEESKQAFDKFKKLSESQTAQRETSRKDMVQRLANTRF
jgi:Tfp pilus assembly protein PilF